MQIAYKHYKLHLRISRNFYSLIKLKPTFLKLLARKEAITIFIKAQSVIRIKNLQAKAA